jgi:hypothetical protein
VCESADSPAEGSQLNEQLPTDSSERYGDDTPAMEAISFVAIGKTRQQSPADCIGKKMNSSRKREFSRTEQIRLLAPISRLIDTSDLCSSDNISRNGS